MYHIRVRNVNEAYVLASQYLLGYGRIVSPRGQETIELPWPLTTTYLSPMERVCLIKERDANPFFHLMEALWILAGRNDVAFLTKFNKRMAEFSDDGKQFHAAYGFRLLSANPKGVYNQIEEVIKLLIKEPDTRRAVLQIWDYRLDLNVNSKDIPCNDMIFLKIRNNKLNMTVCNRSNDMIWGAYGANVVQFSMLQEYIAGRVDVGVGIYTQISDSFHVYTGNPQWDRIKNLPYSDFNPYKYDVQPMPIMDEPAAWDEDLKKFMAWVDDNDSVSFPPKFINEWFTDVPLAMYHVWQMHKQHRAGLTMVDAIEAEDWRMAAIQWLEERE